MNIYLQGLTISVVGMSLTFLALGLLILAMIVLERTFRDGEPEAEEAPPAPVVTTVDETADEEIAAVIATALAYWRGKSQSGLGATMETAGADPWWAMGRSQQNPAEALQKIKGR